MTSRSRISWLTAMATMFFSSLVLQPNTLLLWLLPFGIVAAGLCVRCGLPGRAEASTTGEIELTKEER